MTGLVVMRGGRYCFSAGIAEKVQLPDKPGRKPLNWNGSVRIAERNWHAFSWRTPGDLRLAQMLSVHLKALQ